MGKWTYIIGGSAILIIVVVIILVIRSYSFVLKIRKLYAQGIICVNTNAYDTTFKNNNPGNIRWFTVKYFTGESGTTYGSFAIFDDVRNGIAAIGQQILIDYHKHGFTTIDAIIGSYAPSSENDTAAYADSVVNIVNTAASQTLTVDATLPDPGNNALILSSFIQAIIFNENSVTVPLSFINYCLQNIS